MGLVYQICRGITLGIIIGFVAGGFKIAFPNNILKGKLDW